MNPAPRARRIVVEGRVQGVGFRAYTRRMALRLGVSGWVRNRADGTVEALVVGAAEDVEDLTAALRRGPPGSRVTDMRIESADLPDLEDSDGFRVRASA